MSTIPTLETERLILRPFQLEDGLAVQCLGGEKEVAKTTFNMPNPYEDGMAEAWIQTHVEQFNKGKGVILAIVLKETRQLIGTVCLLLSPEHDLGELAYWIGLPYWGKGYCTEAARKMLAFGFEELALNRIFAIHMANNPASGQVMKKIGLKYEGTLRQHFKKWGQYCDLVYRGLLRKEYITEESGVNTTHR